MRTIVSFIALSILATALTGCATSHISAPCPDFGKHCSKIPVNSWDYSNNG